MRLKGQTIWITGASSGVGEGMARVFHREGAQLVLSARRAGELERVKADCAGGPGEIMVLPFDVADAGQRAAAADEVLARCPRLDVLVNNAGISQRSLAIDTDLEVDRRIMEVDFFGPVDLSKRVLPRMIEQGGGQLIVTSSVAGKHGVPYRTTYSAAKHALHGYFDTLRIEVLEHQVHTMLLVIAGVKSNVARHALLGDGSEFGHDDWNDSSGMSAEDCALRVVEAMLAREQEPVICIPPAMEAMKLKTADPVAFTKRMANMLAWMAQNR